MTKAILEPEPASHLAPHYHPYTHLSPPPAHPNNTHTLLFHPLLHTHLLTETSSPHTNTQTIYTHPHTSNKPHSPQSAYTPLLHNKPLQKSRTHRHTSYTPSYHLHTLCNSLFQHICHWRESFRNHTLCIFLGRRGDTRWSL